MHSAAGDLARLRAEAFRHQMAALERRAGVGKWIRFSVAEIVAITGLIVLSRLILLHRIADPTIGLLLDVLIVVAAIATVAIPVMTFGLFARRVGPPR